MAWAQVRVREVYLLPRIQADCYALLARNKKTKMHTNQGKSEVNYFFLTEKLTETQILCANVKFLH